MSHDDYVYVLIYFRLDGYSPSEWHTLVWELEELIRLHMWVECEQLVPVEFLSWADDGSLLVPWDPAPIEASILTKYHQGGHLRIPPASRLINYAENTRTHFEGEILLEDTSDYCTILKIMHLEYGFDIVVGGSPFR